MPKRTKAAERARRYRDRRRQRTEFAGTDFDAQVEAIRRLARPDAPINLVRRYCEFDVLLSEEMAGGRRSRQIRELTDAQLAIARELGVTPKERRLAGDPEDETISAAIRKSVENARAVQARAWTDMREEIRLFGERPGSREVYLREIADLRLAHPNLFSTEELKMSVDDLFDRVAASPADAPVTDLPAN